MEPVYQLIAGGDRARRIMGEAAYATAVERARSKFERIVGAKWVGERWRDGVCTICDVGDGVNLAPGIGFEVGYYGRLVGIEGTEPDCAVAFHEAWRGESKAEPGSVEVKRVWFDVMPDERFADAFARIADKVARALDPKSTTPHLSSRLHVELESRVGVMWLQLRGRLFWNSTFHDCATALYYDLKHNLGNGRTGGYLMRIASDDFRTWYASHAPSKASVMKKDSPLLKAVDMASLNPEVSSGVVPGNLWDRRGDAIYVSCGDSMMCKVTAKGCEMVANGTDDVVFMGGKTLKEWDLLEGDGEDPFETTRLFSTANYRSTHGQMIVRLWFLGLFACLRAKPALVFTGPARSGKTRSAEGVSELLGVKYRCATIQENGADDFWVSVNDGGIICFDNVDSRTSWFGNDMQLACTKGMKEKRRLYSEEARTFEAKAAIMLTSNNPLFASESGLTDRCQICRLNVLKSSQERTAGDVGLTDDIEARRNAALTWTVRTISRALADSSPVDGNVNMRHPDFAAFALRCARAIGKYDQAVAALKSAEFDKVLFTLQNDPVANYIFKVVQMEQPPSVRAPNGQPAGYWRGTATDMAADIRTAFEVDEKDRAVSTRTIGKVISKFSDQFADCFEMDRPRLLDGKTHYCFRGFTSAFLLSVGAESPSDDKATPIDQESEGTGFEDEPAIF